MATLFVVRSYELISFFLFLSGIVYICRSKHPVYVGIYLASSIGGGVLEWVFDSKYYFRLTSDEQFFAAWTLAGEKAPAAMILFYGFFFGIPLVILRSYRKHLERRIGSIGIYCVILMLGLLGTPAFECTNTSVFEIYKYHQKKEYLLWGMPYSNLWFGVLMMGLPYWALERISILIELLPRTSLSRLEQQCLAAGVGFGAVITGFFVAASINGIWYAVAGDIWTESVRSF